MCRTSFGTENLVQQQGCYPQSCSGSYDSRFEKFNKLCRKCVMMENTSFRWSEWGDWSTCDTTCGKGGLQLRLRFCLSFNGTEFNTAQNECNGSDRETKPCQYKSSCPEWDNWGPWSECLGSCGQDGVTTRKRNCVYYR